MKSVSILSVKRKPSEPPVEQATRPRPKGYFFLTPVWGEAYTRLFLDTAIPAQLSPGNLPVFQDSPQSQYLIFTTPGDEKTIRAAPVFKRLSDIIKVRIETITDPIHFAHDMMSACHKRGIVLANQADAAALFLNPDLVFADGSFRTVRRLAEQGYDVILVPGIRTLKQGVVRRLHADFKQDDILAVPPRALMRTALDNLHPLADSSWWEEGESDLIPANLYWRAGTEGIVARCFHLHPLMVYPQRKNAVFFGTVDDDYFVAACPDGRRDYIVTDSDDLLAIELSDPGRTMPTGFRKQSFDDTTVWAEQFTNGRHRRFLDAVVRMHTGRQDQEAWAAAEKSAESVVNTITARLSLSAWRLLLTGNPALMRRWIRWSRDLELHKANSSRLSFIPPQAQQTGSAWAIRFLLHLRPCLLGMLSGLLSHYYRLAWRLFRSFSAIKLFIYGRPYHPYLWTWRYCYLRQLHRDMSTSLQAIDGHALALTYDQDKSLVLSCLNRAHSGLFVPTDGGIAIIDRASSRSVDGGQYHTVIVERALPPARQLDAAIREIARVLAPGGTLILLVNRMPAAADRLDYEICATTGAIAKLLAPEFAVRSQRKQGAFAQGLSYYMVQWVKVQLSRLRLPFLLTAMFSIFLMPLNILLALSSNGLAFLLDAVDTTGRGYISSITIATKSHAEL